ncbi:hypothetical protein BT96DRAFT_1007856 [Gymnopus androsaceus JB14]|uniref:Uncharacterized protein n=1 Tax=Gymnopus androsaceus JB14 TaxID=1447944 RepID=A0A6A4GGD1_9AGAR|nr:hypothetical protein BT96DRAFT_1007856 [Gymnopus androsaceus JB14]
MHSPLLNDDFYSEKSSGTLFLPCSVTESIILLGTFPTHVATLITAFEKDEYYVPDEDDPIPKYQLFPFARNDGPPPTTFYPVLLSRPYPVVTQPPSHAEGRQLYLAISYVQETMIRYFCPYTELPIIKLDDDKSRTLFRQCLARIKSSLSEVYRVADKGGIPGHVLQMLTKDWLLPLDEITAILKYAGDRRIKCYEMDVPIPFNPDTREGEILLLYAHNKTLDDFTPPATAESSSKVKSSVKVISTRPKPKAGASSTAKSGQTPLSPTKPALPKTKETSPVVPTIPKKRKAAPSNKDQTVEPDLPKKKRTRADSKAAREEKTSQIPKNVPAKGKATPKTKAKDKSASIASSQSSASVSIAESIQPGRITRRKPAPSSASNEVEVTEPPSKMLPGKLSVKNTKKIPVIDPQSRVAEFAKGLPNAKPEELLTLINPEFSLGQPSGLYLPADEPSKASRIHRLFRLPDWEIAPDLENLGPFVKASGVHYNIEDLQCFTHSLPNYTNKIYGACLACVAIGKGNECTPCLNDKGHFGGKCGPCQNGARTCSHNSELSDYHRLLDATYAAANRGPLGCQTLLDTLSRSREHLNAAHDNLCRAVKLAEQARQRVVDDFVSFRNANMDPNLFFQYLVRGRGEQDEPLELNFNSVSFYATVFGWDSSLNFDSVIEDRSKVSEWLKKHSIDLVYYEGRFRLPSTIPTAEVPESTLEARGDDFQDRCLDSRPSAIQSLFTRRWTIPLSIFQILPRLPSTFMRSRTLHLQIRELESLSTSLTGSALSDRFLDKLHATKVALSTVFVVNRVPTVLSTSLQCTAPRVPPTTPHKVIYPWFTHSSWLINATVDQKPKVGFSPSTAAESMTIKGQPLQGARVKGERMEIDNQGYDVKWASFAKRPSLQKRHLRRFQKKCPLSIFESDRTDMFNTQSKRNQGSNILTTKPRESPSECEQSPDPLQNRFTPSGFRTSVS